MIGLAGGMVGTHSCRDGVAPEDTVEQTDGSKEGRSQLDGGKQQTGGGGTRKNVGAAATAPHTGSPKAAGGKSH